MATNAQRHYKNDIKVRYDRVEQALERKWRWGLERNFGALGAIVQQIAPWIFPPTKRSPSPLGIDSNIELHNY